MNRLIQNTSRHDAKRFLTPFSGYVLLMTLMLIALAGLLLAGFARQSLLLATESLDAQNDLQRRWGARSCELALLSQADDLFRALDDPQKRHSREPIPSAAIATTLELGGMTFGLRLADEDAKVNLNALYSCCDEQEVAQLVRELSRSASQESPAVLLRPHRVGTPQGQSIETVRRPIRPTRDFTKARSASEGKLGDVDPSGRDRLEPVFGSWGQVFSLERAPRDVPTPETVAAATIDMTCWGSGRLNLSRASDNAVLSLCQLVAGTSAARRLHDLRREEPNRKPADLLNRLQLEWQQRAQLDKLLIDESRCYSLWLSITKNEQHWYEFCVAVVDPGEDSKTKRNRSASGVPIQLSHFVW